MQRITYRDSGGRIVRGLPFKRVPEALKDAGGLLWIDMCDPSEAEWRKVLVDTFDFHPLAVEDAIQDVNHPKIDDYGDYLYLAVHGVRMDIASRLLRSEELDIFLGANYIITFHSAPNSGIDQSLLSMSKDDRRLRFAPDMFLACMLEQVMDMYMSLMESMDQELEVVEDEVLKKSGPEMLERIIDLRHSISNLRRTLSPQREMLGRLSRSDFRLINEKSRPYFRDVYDQSVRTLDIVESGRDLAAGLLEVHLTVISNKLNDIMRVLMVVSVIIMPLTLISGIYGMNLKILPMANHDWGFLGVMGLMAAVAGGLALYFKKKRWL
ncbi:MAG: magnesium/cobalt transporter CorA [Myxococcota bacterium]|jgi:magnesium transporter